MIYKRGKFYWYKFVWDGRVIRESTRQGNDKVARNMESAHRTSLAKGEVGIREKKPIPTLGEFIENRFRPSAKAQFEQASPKTWLGRYRPNLKVISEYKPLSDKPITEITSEHACDFAAHRQIKPSGGGERGKDASGQFGQLLVARAAARSQNGGRMGHDPECAQDSDASWRKASGTGDLPRRRSKVPRRRP